MRFFLFCLFTLFLPFIARAEISANFKSGAVVIGPAADNECVTATAGALRWNPAVQTHEMCNGTQWRKIISTTEGGTPSTPALGTGYFVVSNDSFNGNLGGLPGADAVCLTDLQNNNWMGKADAQSRGIITAGNIKAFLCTDTNSCRNLMPSTTYTFAASGQPMRGGATFTTNSAGLGPNNNINWAGTNYFGGDYQYWTSRLSTNEQTWSATGNSGGSSATCSYYTTTAASGRIGTSNATDSTRWTWQGTGCSTPNRLICIVHP